MNVIRGLRIIGSVILGAALIVGVISAFLPWLTSPGLPTENGFVGVSAGGFLYFIVVLDAGVFFIIRELPWETIANGHHSTSMQKRMALPIPDWLLYLIAGIAGLGAALLFFKDVSQANKDLCFSPTCTDSFYPAGGSVVAFVAALAICFGAILKYGEPQPPPSGQKPSSLVFGILGIDALVFLIDALSHVSTIM